jgi:hypothetical protein
MREKAER